MVDVTTVYASGWTLREAAGELSGILDRKQELLAIAMPSAPRPGRAWTRQQELGHLCDSALNNLQRFARLQIPAHLEDGVWRAQGYAQDDWVRVMDYQNQPWTSVVELWFALNRQVLRLMRNAPAEALGNAWLCGEERFTLEWLLVDYVGHQQHHLKSIL
ncbi:MAG: hypothetical protein R2729_14200 [Bryobacteraceae bacterium]